MTSFSGSLICRRVIFTSGSRYMKYLVQSQETHLFRLHISNDGGMQQIHSASCIKCIPCIPCIPSRFEPFVEQILARDPQKPGVYTDGSWPSHSVWRNSVAFLIRANQECGFHRLFSPGARSKVQLNLFRAETSLCLSRSHFSHFSLLSFKVFGSYEKSMIALKLKTMRINFWVSGLRFQEVTIQKEGPLLRHTTSMLQTYLPMG